VDHTPESLAELMMGTEPPRAALERIRSVGTASVLEIRELHAKDDIGLTVLEGLTLGVRAGEILGIAGVSGNGQEELVEVLAGQRPSEGGSIRIAGSDYQPSREQIRKHRVRLLPEVPLRNACVANMSVSENIAFRCFDEPGFTRAGFMLDKKAQKRQALRCIGDYKIKTPSAEAALGELSGGNVQRTVLARELSSDVALLIAANPCFGLDFAAVAEIRNRIVAARNAGAAVLLVSADLDEIFALSDRIAVMSEGKIVHETPADRADLGEIGRHMAGHST
jgi:simple sugar transport system ATP-binding protein